MYLALESWCVNSKVTHHQQTLSGLNLPGSPGETWGDCPNPRAQGRPSSSRSSGYPWVDASSWGWLSVLDSEGTTNVSSTQPLSFKSFGFLLNLNNAWFMSGPLCDLNLTSCCSGQQYRQQTRVRLQRSSILPSDQLLMEDQEPQGTNLPSQFGWAGSDGNEDLHL